MHHDALKIPNRETVLLGRVHQGQHATVVQISATPRTVNNSSAEPPPILMATVSVAKRRATSPLCGSDGARFGSRRSAQPDVMVAGKAGGYHNATIQPPSRSFAENMTDPIALGWS